MQAMPVELLLHHRSAIRSHKLCSDPELLEERVCMSTVGCHKRCISSDSPEPAWSTSGQ